MQLRASVFQNHSAFIVCVFEILPIKRGVLHEGEEIKSKINEGSICTNYFVTFVLPDGSKKEFMTGRNNSKFYSFVNEGDTGTFTYKEYNNKTISFSFKKDT